MNFPLTARRERAQSYLEAAPLRRIGDSESARSWRRVNRIRDEKMRAGEMYRADDLIAEPLVKTGLYHNLAEAMRRGCKLRPHQAYGRFRNCKGDSACALGAAALGAGESRPKYTWNSLLRLFPELKDVVDHPWGNWRGRLHDVVVMLNDETRYSREIIADWLCWRGGCTHEIRSEIWKGSKLCRSGNLRESVFSVSLANP